MSLPGILKSLPGSKNSSDFQAAPTREFYGALVNHLHGGVVGGGTTTALKVGVVDLETGPIVGYETENPFGIPKDKAALSSRTGETLLSGVLTETLKPEFYHGKEKELLAQTIARLDAIYEADGICVGQNTVSFDLRWIIQRATRVHGLPIPAWMTATTAADGKYRLLQNRIVDTCKLFDSYSRFAKAHSTMKLSNLARYWGREDFKSEGATFGADWRAGSEERRKALMGYNAWNMLDSLVLATLSGVLDSYRMNALVHLRQESPIIPVGRTWGGTDYSPDDSPLFNGPPSMPDSNVAFMGWITAPAPGLLENGPPGGWGRLEEETKAKYPFTSGRMNAAVMQIVGFVCASSSGVEYVWNPNDEFDVIRRALAIMDARRSDSRCFTESKPPFRALLTFRASLYNVILEPWVNGFAIKDWLRDFRAMGAAFDDGSSKTDDSVSQAAIDSGMLTTFSDIDQLPTFCGQNEGEFQERATLTALAGRAFIVNDPWTLPAESSLFPVNTEF
jgi:hypothetical protein